MTTISLRGPVDLLAALPFQLGYHPDNAVVVVAMSGRTVVFIQRLDLPEPQEVSWAVDVLLAPLLRHRPDGVFLVGYEHVEGASGPLLIALRESCEGADVSVRDVLVVRAGRWFAPWCDEGCCPAEGALLPAPHEVPAVADFVGMERSALPSREALDGQLAPDPGVQAAVARECRRLAPSPKRSKAKRRGSSSGGAEAVLTSAEEVAERALDVWAMVCDVGAGRPPLEGLSNKELAMLAVSLRDVHFRDALIAWICPGALPLDILPGPLGEAVTRALPVPAWDRTAARYRTAARGRPSVPREPDGTDSYVAAQRFESRLRWLCRATPPADLPAMLTLLANFTWWRGDGAAARTALDRALDLDPDYRLAHLLMRMLDLALRPGTADSRAGA